MAASIGAKLELDGEKQYRDALKAVTSEIKALDAEMKTVTSQFGKNSDSMQAYTAKHEVLGKQVAATQQKLGLLTTEYDKQKSKLGDLGSALEQAKTQFGENSAEAQRAQNAYDRQATVCNNLRTQIANTTTSLNDMNTEMSEGQTEMQNVQKESKSTGSALESVGNIAAGLGETIKTGFSALGSMLADVAKQVGALTLDFVKDSVEVGSQFDTKMAQVAATMGTSVDQIGDLRDFAKQMGASTAFSASQAAEALNYMALAGYSAEESMEALPNVLNLAAAGDMELGAASDMVTDAASALGLSMDESAELVDKMAQASSKSNTSVAQLGEAILTVGGTAKNLAGGTTELATALGILADNGVKGAEGGTALRNIILSLTAPTDKAAAQLDALGVSAFDAEGNMRPLNYVFEDLNAVLSEMTSEEKSQVMSTIFNKRDLKSVEALLANCDQRFDELSGYIDQAAFSVDEFKANLGEMGGSYDSMETALGKLGVSAETFSDTLSWCNDDAEAFAEAIWEACDSGVEYSDVVNALGGDLDAVQQAFDATTGAAQKMADTQLDNLEGDMTIFQSAVEGAQIAISEGINPTLRELVQTGTDAISKLTNAFNEGGFTGLMDSLGGVISDLVVKITEMLPQVIQGGTKLITGLVQGLVSNTPKLIEAATQIVQTLVSCLVEAFPQLFESGGQLVQTLMDTGAQLSGMLAEGLREGLPELISMLPEVLLGIIDFFSANLDGLLQCGVEIINGLVDGLLNSIPDLINALPDVIDAIVTFIAENLPTIIQSGVDIVLNLIDGIVNTIPDLIAAVPDIIESIIKTLSENLPKIIDSGMEILGSIIDGIGDALPQLIAAVPEIISSIVTTIADNLPNILQAGVDILTKIVDGILNNLPKVASAAGKIASSVISAIRDWMGKLSDIGKSIVDGIKNGISGAWTSFTNWIGEKVGGIVSAVKGMLGIHSPSTVFAGIGENMAAGLSVGFADQMNSVQRDIDGAMGSLVTGPVEVAANTAPIPVTGTSLAGMDADTLAAALQNAMANMTVVLNGRRVGSMMTRQQSNDIRARGAALLPV